MTEIALINRTRHLTDAQFLAMLPGLQAQITEDFAPVWGSGATLHLVSHGRQPAPGQWHCWLLDHSDQPGALGYHDDPRVPEAKIFVADDLKYGAEVSVTISHELLEMLADPLANKLGPLQPGHKRYAIEVADPVEADSDGYLKHGVKVSNFVTPHYFGLPPLVAGDQRLDFCGKLSYPCPSMLPGGYVLFSEYGHWHTLTARQSDGSLSRRAQHSAGRSARRAGTTPAE